MTSIFISWLRDRTLPGKVLFLFGLWLMAASSNAQIINEQFSSSQWPATTGLVTTQAGPGKMWSLERVRINSTQPAVGSGSAGSLIFRSAQTSTLTLPRFTNSGLGKIFVHARVANTAPAGSELLLQKFSTATNSWSNVATYLLVPGAGTAIYETDLNDVSSNPQYRIVASGTDNPVNIHDVRITQMGATSEIALVSSFSAHHFVTPMGTPSGFREYKVSGSNLTADLTIQAPTHFQVSLDSMGTYSSSLTLTPVAGNVIYRSIFVRYNPTAAGSHSAQVSNTSTGATTRQLLVTGNSNPSLTVTGSFFHVFNQVINTPSVAQVISVEGSLLSSSVVITAPANFEVSLTSATSGYAATAELFPSGSTLASSNVWIRYRPTTLGSTAGQVQFTSNHMAPRTVNVSGNAVAVKPTISSTIFFGTITSTSIEVLFSGGNGQKRIVVAHRDYNPFTDPSDANEYTADNFFGQGSDIGNENYVVYNGTGNSVTVTVGAHGLYVFHVYEYNDDNVPGAESYLVPGGYGEQPTAADTYEWIATAGEWSLANNWLPARTAPNDNDILVFDGLLTPSCQVFLDFATNQPVGQLKFINNVQATLAVPTERTMFIGSGLPGPDILVEQGAALVVTTDPAIAGTSGFGLTLLLNTNNTAMVGGKITFTGVGSAPHRLIGAGYGSVEFLEGSEFIAGLRFGGNAFGTDKLNSVVFKAGSQYTHIAGANPFGATQPNSVTIFETGSLYRHEAPTASLHFNGRTYANLHIMNPAYVQQVTGAGAIPLSIDNLLIAGGNLQLGINTTINIKGDVTVTGGSLLVSPTNTTPQTLNFAGTTDQLISGAGTVAFGERCNVVIPADASVILEKNITVNHSFSVSGSLDAGNAVLSGTGTFSVLAGGSFKTSMAAGIATTGSTGNVQVGGNRSFGFGHYTYYGNAQQTGLGLPTVVASLIIDADAPVTLSRSTRVEQNLSLLHANVNTTISNLLTVGANGVINGGSAASYVNGPLSRISATTDSVNWNLPVGKNGVYRPANLTLKHTTATVTTYTAELHNGMPPSRTLPLTLNEVSDVRYMRILKGNGATLQGARVVLSYGSDDGVNNPTLIRVAKSQGSDWLDLGGAVNTTDQTITSLLNFTTFSDFVIAKDFSPLPVDIISFTAAPQGKTVAVNWATASEKDSDYFEVERSEDGQVYRSIGRVEARGNSEHRINYSLIDENPAQGLAYYRLRQVDIDGTTEFFGPVVVRMGISGIEHTSLFPNPAQKVATLQFEATAKEQVQVRVYNTIGLLVTERNLTTNPGINSLDFNVERLQPGVYMVEINTLTGREVIRLMKQ